MASKAGTFTVRLDQQLAKEVRLTCAALDKPINEFFADAVQARLQQLRSGSPGDEGAPEALRAASELLAEGGSG